MYLVENSWQASWIWASEQVMGPGRYLYLRRSFEIEASDIVEASVRVCADTRYRLWMNGQSVVHGPARSAPSHQYYDVIDVRDRLRSGANVLCVLVTHYGVGTCYSCLGRPGFLLQLDAKDAAGQTMSISTDATWKVAPAPYETGYDRMSIQLAYPEVFDARREPISWNLPGFDDADWPGAVIIGPVGMEPWTTLIPRDIALPTYRAVAPVAVLQTNRIDRSGEPEEDAPRQATSPFRLSPAACMQRATILQPAPSEAVTYSHPALLTISPQMGDTGVSVVLDFGREVSGFPLLVPRKGGGGRIDIGYSERLEADGSVDPAHAVGSEMQYADRLLLRSGFQKYEPLDHRAFRYMRLDFYDCPEPIEILIEMTLSGYPVTRRGEFQCSDALLQQIWEVGRYTTELCMDDGFMDCPFRERGQWLGDVRVEALVAAYAFGDTRLARKALLQFPQSQNEAGWFKGVFPSETSFDALLPTFCCIWLVALWDYFLLTADRSLLEQVWPNVERLIDAIVGARDPDGVVANLPGWVFVDWAPLETGGQSTAVNAFVYDGLRAAARIARSLGFPERGGDLQILADDIRDAVNDVLWDNQRGVYVDGVTDGQRSTVVSEQANVLCALVGIADRQQKERLLHYLYPPEGVAPQPRIPIATPYFAFYLHRLLYAEQRHSQALALTRKRWGDMIQRGASTFWEQWDPYWSLYHAWSATPTYDLVAEIAGIRPMQPGFEEIAVDLHPCHLTWLRAKTPTLRGNIEVSYHYRADEGPQDSFGNAIAIGKRAPAITVNLMIPATVWAHVRIPLHSIALPTISINKSIVWQSGIAWPKNEDRFTRHGDFLVFSIRGGSYHIEIAR